MIFIVRNGSSFIFSKGRSSGQEKNSALHNNETPSRRWEDNVVSWAEMGKLFDALTVMSNLMRAQKEVTYCNRPKRFHERIAQEDMQRLKEDRKTLIRNINMLTCTSKEMPEDR